MSQIDDFLNDKPSQGSGSQSEIDSFLSDAPKDGPLARGFNRAKQSMAITGNLATGDAAGAARNIREAAEYSQANPGMAEGRELSQAWQRGDGVTGGISEVVGEIKKDWNDAPGLIGKIGATGRNLRAMGEGIVEQVPNMIAPTIGMVGGGAAGSYAGLPGMIGGAWLGASAGNTLVEGGGMAQEALQKAGIDPRDTAAVEQYLKANGNQILGQSATKGAIIGAVDTLTAGLAGKVLNAPARAAATRALADLGVDTTNKAAVKAAMETPQFAAKIAQDAAYKASTTGIGNLARNVGAAALDPAGEFTGEFVGQGVATGEWDTKNAALEALSSIGQSGVMFAGQKGYQALTRPNSKAQPQPAPVDEVVEPVESDSTSPGNPPRLGFNPLAGTPTIYPDGTVALNSEQEFAKRNPKPSEAMGIDRAAGPLSRAAADAVDSGASPAITPTVMANPLVQAAQAPAPTPPVVDTASLKDRTTEELRGFLRNAQDTNIRKAISSELARRKREEMAAMSDPLQQSLIDQPKAEQPRATQAPQAVQSQPKAPQEQPRPLASLIGGRLTDTYAAGEMQARTSTEVGPRRYKPAFESGIQRGSRFYGMNGDEITDATADRYAQAQVAWEVDDKADGIIRRGSNVTFTENGKQIPGIFGGVGTAGAIVHHSNGKTSFLDPDAVQKDLSDGPKERPSNPHLVLPYVQEFEDDSGKVEEAKRFVLNSLAQGKTFQDIGLTFAADDSEIVAVLNGKGTFYFGEGATKLAMAFGAITNDIIKYAITGKGRQTALAGAKREAAKGLANGLSDTGVPAVTGAGAGDTQRPSGVSDAGRVRGRPGKRAVAPADAELAQGGADRAGDGRPGTGDGTAALTMPDVPETNFGDIESAKAALKEARAEVDRVNEVWSRLYRDGVAYIVGDGPSRKVAPNAPQDIKDRFEAYKKAKSAAKRNYDAAAAAVDALTPKKERPVAPSKPEPVAQQEPAKNPRQLNGSDTQKAKALFTLPAGSIPRPARWRQNALQAKKVARELGLNPDGKRLAEIVAEVDAFDARSNVQDTPQGTERVQAKAPADQAPEAARGDGAETGRVPDTRAGDGVRKDGVEARQRNAVAAVYYATQNPYDERNKTFRPIDSDRLMRAIEDAKKEGIKVTPRRPANRDYASTWVLEDDAGNVYTAYLEPSGRGMWKQNVSAPEKDDAPQPKPASPGAGDVQADGVEGITRTILESIADQAKKTNRKYYDKQIAKGLMTRDEADRRIANDEKMWAEQKVNDRTERIAKAIAEKDPTVLVGAWAKEGQGTYGNEGSMEAFRRLTGINLARMNSADRAKAIFDWAGWSEDQVRADVEKRRAERNEQIAKAEEKRKQDDAAGIERLAASTKLTIEGQDGETTVKAYIDRLIEQGYTEVGQTKVGAIKRTLLFRPGANSGYPMRSGILADYAKVASERFKAKQPPAQETKADGVEAQVTTQETKAKPKFAKKEDLDRLFGIDQKRKAALDRIAKGTAYFSTNEKAADFVAKSGIKDTHEVVQAKPGRFEIRAKAGSGMQTADAATTERANDAPDWWKNKTPAERVWTLKASGVKGTAVTAWARISADDQKKLNDQWGPKEAAPAESTAPAPAEASQAANAEESPLVKAINDLADTRSQIEQQGSVVDDRLLERERKQKAVIQELQAESDELKEREKAAKAKMLGAAAKLAELLSKNTRMNITPEQEQKMLPIVIELFEGAMDLGYVKFKQAARYVREFIAQAIDQEAADSIPIDTLQGAYIATARRHSDKPITPKGEVIAVDTIADLEEQGESSDTGVSGTAQQPTADQNASTVQTGAVPAAGAGSDQQNAAAGNRDSQPVGAGVAASGQEPAGNQPVSGRTETAGARGEGDSQRTGQQSPGATRDPSGVRADAESSDFVIDADDIGKGGLTKKYRDNVAAIRILKTLEAEGRVATPDERKQLAKYVGWGAMKGPFDPANKQWAKQHAELKELLTPEEFRAARKSTLDAHYTSPVAVGAMNDALARIGYKGGRMLEPSVGVGNFLGLMPSQVRNSSQIYGVELDSLTSRMVAALYPKAKIAKATGFEDFQIPAEFFDLVQGNPPFGNQPLVDNERSPYSGFSIHNYFLAKGIDKLRPGGIMQVVVSHNFLDAQDGRAREWIGQRANLIGAVRLPNTAFQENAGTQVVTDILIFQKKSKAEADNGLSNNLAPWQKVVDQVNVNPKTGESVTHKVNEFFTANPQLILGKPSAGGTMYGPNQYTVESTGDIKPKLDAWVQSLPENIYSPIERKPDAATDMAVPDGVKVGSYYVGPNGEIMQRGEDVMGDKRASPWVAPNAKAAERMKGMIGLREALRNQMRLERSPDASEAEIEANRAELNKLYDDFLKKHGHVNSQMNRRLFLDDTEAQLIQALEFDYDKGVSKATAEKEGIEAREPSATKADIFQRRVAFPPQDFLTVTTAKDALLASLNYRGKVDADYMAEVYGKPMAEIIEELGDVVYEDPQSGIVTADEYLSGDVKTKLSEAKAAAQTDSKYKRNVEALEKVIPADKKPSEITVSIGAAFVPAEIYEQFVKHISGGEAKAAYVKATGQWLMDFQGRTEPALNSGKFGTDQLSAQELFQLSMLGRGAVVKKTYRNPDGSTTTVVLEKETEAAREKQNAIRAEWQTWLWSDPARAEQITTIYNEKLNRIVERKYDGSHLSFPGMNPAIGLLEHQKNGVWRGLQSYQVLYDHVVGAGKTFEMATLAMEMRRLGISRKPLFVVPNHLTLQWRSEFTRLYPGSNILAATPEDFSKDNRERLFSKIITGDWDAVVIGHSSLKKIGLPEATEKAVLQEQIDEVSQAIEDMKRARGDRNIIRDMEGIRARLEAKMKDKLAAIGKRSKVVTFDELGIDAMFIDEMHEFKNLAYNSTMDRNPGMGNPNGSAKAFDLFVKTRWLFDTFGQKTPYITATGTPVSNSLVEMFNMQRYMQYPTLKAEGLHVFDAWAKQFGSVENVYEVAPSGSGYRQSTRFSKFANLPGLMSLYNSFADTITLDDLKAQEEAQGKRFPVPKMVGGKPQIVVAQRSPAVANLMGVPKAQTTEDGQIKFLADLNGRIQIDQKPDTGKWTAKVGESYLGEFDTEQDARLKIVERALTPEVTVEPGSILGRFANLKQLTKETKGKVNALSLTGEANKAGLDYRLVNPAAPDFPGSKINLAVENMVKTYKKWNADKGTQLVFCDLSIPLSARASYSSKARRLYVRDESGALDMKRGTMHTLEGQESIPYFVVQRGEKDLKRFDVYDAVSGSRIGGDFRTKQDAIDQSNALLADENRRQRWIERRETAGEISQEAIDEYNNENDIEADGIESFTREDIAGVSGAAKFSVYDDIKAKLIAKGIPEREIAFIHDYSTPAAKDKLFKAVNTGEIRFLLGSTPKMGAGTNVQKRLVGLHHIDAPWRPSDLEQREGRIIRRGNELYSRDPDGFEVFVGRYATEQTYDTRRWQILEHKARGIEQLRNFDGTINEIDDIEGEAANAADMKAAASGDPLILEETRLRNDVRRLEQLQAAHADDVVSMNRKARAADEFAKNSGPSQLAQVKELADTAKKNPLDKDGFAPITIDGKKFDTKEAAQEEIGRALTLVRSSLRDESTVIYRGIEFTFMRNGNVTLAESPTGNVGSWTGADPFSASGFVQRMANYVSRLPAQIENIQATIEKAKSDALALREQAKAPFAQASDLAAAREEYKRVQRALLAKGPAVPESQKPALAAGIQSQKDKLQSLGFGEALREFFSSTENNDEANFGTKETKRQGTPVDRAVMDMAGEGRDANDILSFIANNSKSPYRRNLARKLLATGANPAVSLGGEMGGGAGFRFLAKYSRKNHEVTLSEAAGDLAEQIFLHETVHAATLLALDKGGLQAQQMIRLYESAKKQGLAEGQYGMKNVGEFVAEAFTNPEFQKILKSMKAPEGNLWKRFVALVRRILGMSDGSQDMLTAALEVGAKVMRENIPLRAARSFRAEDGPAFMGVNQTETPAFRRWFGDSKVVDADGKPLVVYHGTSKDFKGFADDSQGSNFDDYDGAFPRDGFWFTANPDNATWYANVSANGMEGEREGGGQNIKPVYLKITNPFRYTAEMFAEEGEAGIPSQAELEEQGYDGIIVEVTEDDDGSTMPAEAEAMWDKYQPIYGAAMNWPADLRAQYNELLDAPPKIKHTHYVAFRPEQIKSAIGNNGNFDPEDADIAHFGIADASPNNAREAVKPVVQLLNDTFKVKGKLSWWHKTVGTPFNLAQRVPEFKRVFDAVQNFINDVSFYGAEAAAKAPKIIPKLETWKDLGKSPISAEDNKAIAAPIFEGTLVWMRDESGRPVKVEDMRQAAAQLTTEQKAQRLLRNGKIRESVLKMWKGLPADQFDMAVNSKYDKEMLNAGVVWTDAELRDQFKLTDEQIGLYREFREATDKSLVDLALSDIIQYAGKDIDPIKDVIMGRSLAEGSEMVRDYLMDMAEANPERRNDLLDTANGVIDKANRVQQLIDRGYAPLQRFGRYTVYAKDENGEQLFFGMYENRWDAARATRQMRQQFPDATIETGMMSEEAYKLFQGISPETLEIFGTMLGMDSQADGATNEAFQQYLKLAKSNRSAMKRLIERKGIAGYSEDASRVLASFLYSNARQTASNLHVGEIMNGVNDIPKNMGDAKDMAMKLARYTMDPQEEAQALRGLLFAQYLGGSIASAMINALQPAQVTFPYLSQFVGVKKSATIMAQAVKDALKRSTGDARLDAALKKAEEDGIVSPQEIFQLMAQAQGKATLKAGDGTKAGDAMAAASNTLSRLSLGWGKVFSIPEQFNRRSTFIAAYRAALDRGDRNPAAFAEQAVKETQFVYNKANRPQWARGSIGALAFTFKTYSISYVELLQRMAKSGPEGRRAAMLMVGVLFLMAGAGGLPGVEDAEDVVDGIAQRVFGLNFQTRQKRQEWLAELFGEGGARFIENGLSGLPWSPTDVSGRLGLGNLIPGTGIFVKKQDYTRDVSEIAGPAADMTKRFLQGAGLLLQGEVLKAGEIVSPVAIRNMVQGGRMAATDQYTDARGRKVIDTTMGEAALKTIGFQPANVARVQDATRTVQQMVALNKIRESEIADKWAKAIVAKDQDGIMEAQQEMRDWNQANPDSPIRIDLRQIRKRVQALREDKATRIERTAPKEIRQEVRRELEGRA